MKKTEKYRLDVGIDRDYDWSQLEIGENESNQESLTMYCGGSVAAVDWAPSNGSENFLAVACNSETKGVQMNLRKTSKSCVQIYEVKDLKNDK